MASANVLISTGNILNLKKKPGRKSTEELLETLQVTLCGISRNSLSDKISRSCDDLQEKMNENDRNDISIAAKVFLNNSSVQNLDEPINALLETLKVSYIDNIVLAYHPKTNNEPGSNATGAAEYKWGSRCDGTINQLKKLWTNLEEHYEKKKVSQLGMSDLDTETLADLFKTSKVHPTIAQINLSSCCVVPPALQEFCNKNEIQLLTHSDPEVILPEDSFEKQMNLPNLTPVWTVRYQVHVKCRGLLHAKGYIVGAIKRSEVGDA